MEIVEVKCGNCGKGIYILDDRVREKMFCTVGCLNTFSARPKKHPTNC